MEEIILNDIEWSAPEYKHEEKSVDFLWTIGLVSFIACGVAIWMGNYIFSIFIFISGVSLIFFSVREPLDVTYKIETSGFSLGKDKYEWKKIKGFNIKKKEDESILLVKLDKKLLPVYTIPIPLYLLPQIKESLLKVTENIELNESPSVAFVEKIGF